MTAKSLLNGLPCRNMWRAVSWDRKLMIVICILQLLGIPMVAAAGMFEVIQDSHDNFPYFSMEFYAIIGVMCLGAAIITGMIAATSVYQELWKKSKVDMLYALPLTGKQRFFSHYLAGTILYLLPYLVAVLLGFLIVVVMGLFVDFGALDYTYTTFLGEFTKYYAMGSIGLGVLMWLFYTSSVLLVTCCGTLFENIYSILLLNVLVPGTMAAVIAVICESVMNVRFDYCWDSIGYTSPIGGLIYLIYILTMEETTYYSSWEAQASEASEHGMLVSYFTWLPAVILLTAALLVLAYFLYKKRLAEHVGRPFIYLGAYYLLLTLITVCILCISNFGATGAVILFSAIVYFVMEVIRKRGFRKFWMSAITFVVTVALTLGSFAVINATDGFGRAYYIPSAGSVSSMKIELPGRPYSPGELSLEYTNQDVIKAVQAIQKEINADYRADGSTTDKIDRRMMDEKFYIMNYEYTGDGYYDTQQFVETDPYDYYVDDYYYGETYNPFTGTWEEDRKPLEEFTYWYANSYTVEITYYTLMGTKIHRAYEVNLDQYFRLMEVLQGTDLFAAAIGDAFDYAITSDGQYYDDTTQRMAYHDTFQLEVYTDTLRNCYSMIWITGGEAAVKSLIAAYRQDLANMTAEDYRTSGMYCCIAEFPVWNACTETIAFLEDHGLEPFTAADRIGYWDETSTLPTQLNPNRDYALDVRLYLPEDASAAANEYKNMAMFADVYVQPDAAAYEDVLYADPSLNMATVFPEMAALMEVADPYYITTEACYMLLIEDRWYVIPPEHSDLAEAVIEKGNGMPSTYDWEDYFTDDNTL